MSDDRQDDRKLDRRQFLINAGCAGLFAAGAARLTTGCKKGGGDPSGGGKNSPSGGGNQTDEGGGSGGLDCTDTSGLEDSQIKTRESLEYTDNSPKEDKNCANCQLFEPPEEDGSCGGCQSVPGPIHPDGYCTAWVEQS